MGYAEVVKSSEVGFFEAENKLALDGAHVDARTEEQKRKRLVNCTNFAMKAILPEQGSWHLKRKQEILKAHPELEQLFGHNPWSALFLVFSFAAHMYVATSLVSASWPVVIVVSYTIGALFSWQCATLAHEGAHKLVFKSAMLNKLFAVIAFLPVVGGPFGNFWSVEHMYHHQVVVDKMNRYGPQQAGPVRKAIAALLFFSVVNLGFMFSSAVVYLRSVIQLALFAVGVAKKPFPDKFKLPPYDMFPQIVNHWFMINTTLSILFNAAIIYFYGIVPTVYLFLSSGFSNGLHPLGMRQVQEHYLQLKDQPTYSVYSVFNPILFNLGFHVEHHDFPRIPWNRLPQVRKIAPEFYNNLFSYKSYTEVLFTFLFHPGVPISALLDEFQDVLASTNVSEISRTKTYGSGKKTN